MKSRIVALALLVVGGAVSLLGSGGGSGGDGSVDPCVAELDELADGLLGLSAAANLELDPYGTAPLSALLTFMTPIEGTVTLTVLRDPGPPAGIEISHTFDQPATEFELPVLGLYPDRENTLVVEFDACNGQTTRDELAVVTMPLPVSGNGQVTLPVSVEIIENNLPAGDQSLYLFSQQKSAFDQTGAVRWIYVGEGWQFYRLLPNGNWLGTISTGSNDTRGYHYLKFAEFTLLGEKVREYAVNNYLHHEIRKLPWGNYLVASNKYEINADFFTVDDGLTEEDVLFEVDADTGDIVREWDFNVILDPARPPIPSNDRSDDWLHLNAAYYDAADDTIVITAQRQSLLAKIRYDYQGPDDLLWVLAAHELWTPAWLAQFPGKLLKPVDAQGMEIDDPDAADFWPYGPHAGMPSANDGMGNVTLLAFDNGNFRGWYADHQAGGTSYSRGVEYAIDENAMTVRLSWEYRHVPPGLPPAEPVATDFTGDVDLLPDGNLLLGFAWSNQPDSSEAPRVVEVRRDGTVVFEAVSNRGESEYRVETIDLYAGQ